MKIIQIPSAAESPIYEDENVAAWTDDSISVLLSIKKDKYIYMDNAGWKELIKVIVGFNMPDKQSIDIDTPVQIWVGKYSDGTTAIGLYCGGIMVFTAEEWSNLIISIAKVDQHIQALRESDKASEDQYLKLNDIEISKLPKMAEFNLQIK
ncbi:hypothetical protein JW766_03675 [Candidatus Dojkabacteria bacterium]|nr:hypothetical protein [Candidatus Dojkabacteria bacterium]